MMKTELPEKLAFRIERKQGLQHWMASYCESEESSGSKVLRLFYDSEQSPPDFATHPSCSVIFDGVLYNPEELLNGSERSAKADAKSADVILEAYLRWGEGVLQKIEGIYTLIIWDCKRNQLLCVRDQVGIYPLFYAEAGRELFLSTSMEALASQPKVTWKLNIPALADHLRHRYPKLEETLLAKVNRVPPGYCLRVSNGSRNSFRYWDPVPPGKPVRWAGEDELARFDELLEKAVGRYLALGPGCIFLSGGLDSVSVAAVTADYARRHGLPTPWALSIIYPHPDCNEESVQRSVANGLGLPQVLVPFEEAVGSEGTLRASMELSRNWPVPPLCVNLPPFHRLAQEGKQRGCRVILTGGGGDEWLGVSPAYLADLLRDFDLAGFYRFAVHMKRSFPITVRGLSRNIWRFGLRPLLATPTRRLLNKISPRTVLGIRLSKISKATPTWVAPNPALRRELNQRAEEGLLSVPEVEGYYMKDQRLALDHPLVSMELEDCFEGGRRFGAHWLQPFFDAELIDLLYRSRPELLYKGGRSKAQVREVIHRRFPQLGFDRQKKVRASAFFISMLLQEGPKTWQEIGGAKALVSLGLVDSQQLDSRLQEIFSERQSPELYRIWELANLEAWLRSHI